VFQFSPHRPSTAMYLDIARGVIPNSKIIHKFGANFDIDQNTDPESIWSGGGQYPWASLTTAQTIYAISTSASDTSTMTIEGLDADYNEQTETVTLNGLTAVATTNTFIRVFRMTYDDINVGTLEARVGSGTGTIVAQIEAGDAQTLMAVYTVPAGYSGYLVNFDVTIDSKKDCTVMLYCRKHNGLPFRISHMAETSGHYRYDFTAPLRLLEKTDVDVQVDNVSANDSSVTANFDIILIRDY